MCGSVDLWCVLLAAGWLGEGMCLMTVNLGQVTVSVVYVTAAEAVAAAVVLPLSTLPPTYVPAHVH